MLGSANGFVGPASAAKPRRSSVIDHKGLPWLVDEIHAMATGS
jgi:hypothetical protein